MIIKKFKSDESESFLESLMNGDFIDLYDDNKNKTLIGEYNRIISSRHLYVSDNKQLITLATVYCELPTEIFMNPNASKDKYLLTRYTHCIINFLTERYIIKDTINGEEFSNFVGCYYSEKDRKPRFHFIFVPVIKNTDDRLVAKYRVNAYKVLDFSNVASLHIDANKYVMEKEEKDLKILGVADSCLRYEKKIEQ